MVRNPESFLHRNTISQIPPPNGFPIVFGATFKHRLYHTVIRGDKRLTIELTM